MEPLTSKIRSLHTMRSDGSLNLRHILKRCQEIRANLQAYIEATEAIAPVRLVNFQLDRNEPYVSQTAKSRTKRHAEAEAERRLWSLWRTGEKDFLPPICRRLLCYQFPLKRSQKDKGWGKIDLVGVSPEGTPVVIEMKAEAAKDPLHQVILEGVAYAIALRKAWLAPKGLRQSWANCLEIPEAKLPTVLAPIHVLCLAPEQYWTRSFSEKRVAGQIPIPARAELRGLINDLNDHGIRVHLASLNGETATVRIP